VRTKVEKTLLLIAALAFFAIALWPQLRASISDFALLAAMSAILVLLGAYQLRITRTEAGGISAQLSNSPVRRLWLPARFYTSRILFWQFRLMSIMMIIVGLLTGFLAFIAHRRGL